ncbi:MAG: CoxG family protein [Gammaproteobacteria bacterium]
MEISEERVVAAPPERVFAALNDPAVLQKCIPGCESLEKISDSEMRARVTIKLGPVAARFSGTVQLSDVAPPESWAIRGEAGAGAAGFAKGEAKVQLSAHPRGTLLRWTARAQVGGKIAQLGARLIDGAAKKLAGQFFAALSAHLEESEAPADSDSAAAKTASAARPNLSKRVKTAITIAAIFAVLAAFAALYSVVDG